MILPAWIGRAAALALLATAIAAGYLLIVDPLVSAHRGTDRAIADTRALVTRFESLAISRAQVAGQLDTLRARIADQGHYLAGDTYAVAAAALQDNVKAIVEAHGGALQSIQTLPTPVDSDGRRVGIRVQASMRIDALARTMHRLEGGVPFLFLDNFEAQGRLSRRARQGRVEEDPELLVWFDLYGYLPPVAP